MCWFPSTCVGTQTDKNVGPNYSKIIWILCYDWPPKSEIKKQTKQNKVTDNDLNFEDVCN